MSNLIEFSVTGALGRVHLNSPSTFNALTREMCIAFRAKLLEWADDPAIGAVLVSGESERAFCAGGDIRALYDSHRAGNDTTHMFFWDEYRLDYAVHRFPKPYVALVDGIVMGGGVGISVHGSHRVMTERTMFAMPECGIGLFPDVGGTDFLPRAPGELGMYLALTGARMKAADAIHAGIGTHYMPSAKLDALLECLSNADLTGGVESVDAVVEAFAEDTGPVQIREHARVIDRCFSAPTVPEIVDALEAEDGYFAIETADTLRTKSPTSMLVTHRQLRGGAGLAFEEVMRREYRMACAFLAGHDFFEGIRAAVIDKDRKPRWEPARLEDVGEADVGRYFAPLERELAFD